MLPLFTKRPTGKKLKGLPRSPPAERTLLNGWKDEIRVVENEASMCDVKSEFGKLKGESLHSEFFDNVQK